MDNEASDASSPQQYWLIPERLPGSVLKVLSELLLSFRIIDGDSYVSPSLLHFSSLLWHNFSVLLRCLGRILASHVWLGSQIYRLRLTGSVLQILPSNVGFTLRFCCRESFRSVSARSSSPMVFRSRCQPPPSKPLGAILR
ncbi:unnamed protein product [Brassica oleracea var. botrytis]